MRRRVLSLFRNLSGGRALEQALDDELRSSVEILTQEKVKEGLAQSEARHLALIEFGGVEQVKEEVRAVRAGHLVEDFSRDLRFAFRTLARSPGFTAVAVLSLALGIGAGTAVFSLVNAILLRSLPVPNPQELRVLHWAGTHLRVPSWDGGDASFPPPVFSLLRERAGAQADIFGFVPLSDVIVRAGNEVFPAHGAMVSDNFFSGLGVLPLIGRMLAAGEDYAGEGTSVVIGYDWWEKHFALDPAVLGQMLALNGTGFRIVGVLPRGFKGAQPGQPSAFFVPMATNSQFLYVPITSNFHWYVRLMARLRPGADDARLKAALEVAFVPAGAEFMQEPRIAIGPGRGGQTYDLSNYRKPLLLMLGVVGVVMLVACANLAGLSLARGAAREHELAVRTALGAGRWRLIRQSLTENLVIALAGGGLGVLIAVWGRTGFARLLAGSDGDLRYDFSLDATVLGFTLLAALVTALLSGLLPASRAGRVDPVGGLKCRGALSAPRLRTGKILVAAQIGLSFLLLAGAGLYVRTLANLAFIDAGFSMEKLLLFRVNIRGAGHAAAHPEKFYGSVQDSLAAIPGVRAASFIEFPLLSNAGSTGSFDSFSGRPAVPGASMQTCRLTVGETFFSTMGIPVVQGRGFDTSDNEDTPKIIVVNEAFVRRYLPAENPLGPSIRVWAADWRIVGVCRDIKYSNLKQEVPPTAYFPFRQRFYSRFRLSHLRTPYFAVRTALPPLSLATAARKAVAAIDPDVAVTDFTTQGAVRDGNMSQERLLAALCGGLAGLALLLSCIGLYGLIAYHVARRTGEIGVRVALGATPRDITEPILREALLLGALGIAVGLPVTLALTQFVRGSLYGVRPSDPATMCGTIVLLLTVSALAAWVPARRAARVDPMMSLRRE
jgi:predicted permease